MEHTFNIRIPSWTFGMDNTVTQSSISVLKKKKHVSQNCDGAMEDMASDRAEQGKSGFYFFIFLMS